MSYIHSFRVLLVGVLVFFHSLIYVHGVDTTASSGGQCLDLKNDVFGINAAFIRTNVAYNNPVVEYYLKSRGVQLLRFPGGTVSSTLNVLNGQAQCPHDNRCAGTEDCVDYTCPVATLEYRPNGCYRKVQCTKKYPTTSKAGQVEQAYCKIRENLMNYRGETGKQLDELKKLIASPHWTPKLIIVLNVCGMKPSDSAEVVEKIKTLFAGAGVLYPHKYVRFELGNEIYLRQYEYCVENAAEYGAIAKQHFDAIKAVSPNFQVGIIVSPSCFKYRALPRYKDWNSLVLPYTSDFDAVIIHMYSKAPYSEDLAVTFENHAAYFDTRFVPAIEDLATSMGKPVWVTEWHMSGNSGDEGGSNAETAIDALWGYYGGAFRVLGLLHMFTTPEVHLSNFHSFDKLITGIKNTANISPTCALAESFIGPDFITQSDAETEFKSRVNMVESQDMPQLAFAPVFINGCKKVQKLSFTGTDQVPPEMKRCTTGRVDPLGTFPQLTGALFQRCADERRKSIAVIVSKTAESYDVDMGEFLCRTVASGQACFTIDTLTVYTPRSGSPREYNVVESTVAEHVVTMPGYAVAVLQFFARVPTC